MSFLQRATDFLLFRDLPANQPAVRSLVPLEARSSLSAAVPRWHSGQPTFPSDDVLVMTREGYNKAVTAFACINIIADAVAEATLRVWVEEGSGKRDEQLDHPLRQLMQNPNPGKSEAEFLALTVRIAAIAGYCVIEKVRSRAGNVVQLGHLRMDYLKPILRDQQQPDWEYTIPGQAPAILDARDAVVFTYMDSPFLGVTGDTPLRHVMRQVGILNDLTDFVKMLLERGGMPQVVLVLDPPKEDGPVDRLTPDEIDGIRADFARKYAGVRNWAGPAVLDGMHVEAVGLDLNQMAFPDLRDSVDLEVCRAFRIPPPVAQVMAGLTTSYGQTLEQSMKLLQLYTANPLRRRLDGALTRSLLPEFDLRPNVDLGFDTSDVDALQEDEDAVHARAREDFRAGGITLDEFRQRIGEDPLNTDLGRSLALPYSIVMTPIDTVPVAVPSTTPPAEPEEEGEDGARFLTRSGRTYLNRRALSPEQRGAQDRVVTHQKQAIARLGDHLEPGVRTFLQEQRARIVEAIVGDGRSEPAWSRTWDAASRLRHRQAVTFSTRAVEAIDWMSEDEWLDTVLRQWFALVGETAFADASAVLGATVAWDLSNPHLVTLFDQLGYRITAINETTRRLVEEVVRDSLIDGTTMPELAQRLTDALEPTYRGRSMTVARTESMVGYARASTAAYEASGVVTEVMIADNAEHTEKYAGAADGLSCSERDGLVVPLARGSFHVESDHPRGSACLIPIVEPLEAAP